MVMGPAACAGPSSIPNGIAMSICLKWSLWLGVFAVMPSLFGCGGGGGETPGAVVAPVESTASPESQSFKEAVLQPVAAQLPVRARSVTSPHIFRAASQEPRSEDVAVHLQLLSPDGVQASSLELPPVRGVGYATVRARISSVRAGGETPVDEARPYCPSSVQCEYRTADRGRLDLVYVVKLPDESVARLSAAGNEILVTAKQTAMPVRTAVTIALQVGKHTSTARVAYLGAAATIETSAQGTQSLAAAPVLQPIKPAGSRYPFADAN
jgi:hypothetical protein